MVFDPPELDGAERREVRRCPLDIEEAIAPCRLEVPDEPEQRRLRGSAAPVELRLRGEEAAHPDTVEPAREPGLVPRLDGVRPAELVQARVRLDERRVDPAVGSSRVGAFADHLGKRRVDPDLVPARSPPE